MTKFDITLVTFSSALHAKILFSNSLWIKRTDAANSNFIGIATLHVSGSLSAHHQEFYPYIGFGTFYAVVTVCYIQFYPTPSNKRSQLHKVYQSRFTAKNSWWWAERLPEICRVVIPIKLEFSASVAFIHKESVTTHGHTIVKFIVPKIYMQIYYLPYLELWCSDRLRDGQPRNSGLFQAGAENFFFCTKCPQWLWVPVNFWVSGYLVSDSKAAEAWNWLITI